MNNSTFLKISQVNGPSWDIPYAEARQATYLGEGIEVSVDVIGGPPGFVRQVVAASVSVRDLRSCSRLSPVNLGPEIKIRADQE